MWIAANNIDAASMPLGKTRKLDTRSGTWHRKFREKISME